PSSRNRTKANRSAIGRGLGFRDCDGETGLRLEWVGERADQFNQRDRPMAVAVWIGAVIEQGAGLSRELDRVLVAVLVEGSAWSLGIARGDSDGRSRKSEHRVADRVGQGQMDQFFAFVQSVVENRNIERLVARLAVGPVQSSGFGGVI